MISSAAPTQNPLCPFTQNFDSGKSTFSTKVEAFSLMTDIQEQIKELGQKIDSVKTSLTASQKAIEVERCSTLDVLSSLEKELFQQQDKIDKTYQADLSSPPSIEGSDIKSLKIQIQKLKPFKGEALRQRKQIETLNSDLRESLLLISEKSQALEKQASLLDQKKEDLKEQKILLTQKIVELGRMKVMLQMALSCLLVAAAALALLTLRK